MRPRAGNRGPRGRAGTGQATRRLLAFGADPLVTVEPDPALAAYLGDALGARIELWVVALEDAALPKGYFDLAVAASSFHWVEEEAGLAKLFSALRPGGWLALWWTLFGHDDEPDVFIMTTSPLLEGLHSSPTVGEEGRSPHALDSFARFTAMRAAGFADVDHELVAWSANWDTAGIRALYSTFSPIARLGDARKTEILDEIARIAEVDFGDRVERTLLTSIFTARRPHD